MLSFVENYSYHMQTICIPFNKLSLDQLYAIMRLRQEVFVVEQKCAYLDADGLDQKSLHLLAYLGDELVGYSRLVPRGLSYENYPSIGRVLSSQRVRGKRLGKPLVEASVQALLENFGKQTIKISAQAHLVKFYNNCGFQITGEEYLEDGIPHIGMLRVVEGVEGVEGG